MSYHFSIYCDSVFNVLSDFSNDLINKKITDKYFKGVISSYKAASELYLNSLKFTSLDKCCEAHSLFFQEETNQLKYLIEILSGDYDTVKSNICRMVSKNDQDTVH